MNIRCEETQIANETLFHAAWKWITEQGHSSVEGQSCQYQGPSGGCAFFPAIRDYDEELEENAASDLLDVYAHRLHDWAWDLDRDFADDIQNCHDEYATDMTLSDEEFVEQFKVSMRGLAIDHNIDLYLRERA